MSSIIVQIQACSNSNFLIKAIRLLRKKCHMQVTFQASRNISALSAFPPNNPWKSSECSINLTTSAQMLNAFISSIQEIRHLDTNSRKLRRPAHQPWQHESEVRTEVPVFKKAAIVGEIWMRLRMLRLCRCWTWKGTRHLYCRIIRSQSWKRSMKSMHPCMSLKCKAKSKVFKSASNKPCKKRRKNTRLNKTG